MFIYMPVLVYSSSQISDETLRPSMLRSVKSRQLRFAGLAQHSNAVDRNTPCEDEELHEAQVIRELVIYRQKNVANCAERIVAWDN